MCGLKMRNFTTMWKKIKKEKNRFFKGSSPRVYNLQYDIDSYSQNFDDGYSTNPDDASRTFSARFAIYYCKSFDKGCEIMLSDDNSSAMSP